MFLDKTKALIAGLAIVGILAIFFIVKIITSLNSQGSLSLGSSANTTDSRIQKLEQEVNTLINDINLNASPSAVLNPSNLTPSTSVADQLTSLNSTINQLNTRVTRLEQSTGVSSSSAVALTQATTSTHPAYIPLGSTDPNNNENWQSIDSMAATINPADYPGYTSMQVEVGMRLNAGTGVGNVRLFDSTDQTAVSLSQVSTSSTSFTMLSSSKFILPTGPKLYIIQVMSSLGDTMFIQNARLKVNF